MAKKPPADDLPSFLRRQPADAMAAVRLELSDSRGPVRECLTLAGGRVNLSRAPTGRSTVPSGVFTS